MTSASPGSLPDPADNPKLYRAQLIAVVGDRDPLAIIDSTPRVIRELIEGVDEEALNRRPTSEEWSVSGIVGHLLDDEIINAFRLRLTLTGDQAHYPGTDPERWAALAKPPVHEMLTALEGLRTYHVTLLRSLDDRDWDRTGLHEEQGPESVEIQILKNAGHDLAHLDQLKRCLNG